MFEILSGAVDVYAFWHLLAGLAAGIAFALATKRRNISIISWFIIMAAWEIIEQNILVSWFGLLEPETLMNSAADIVFGMVSFVMGWYMTKEVVKK